MDHHLIAQAATRAFTDITLGNVLTLAGMAVGGFIAWGKLSDRVETMRAQQTEHQKRLEAMAEAGMPTVCRLHTERLANIEEQLRNLPAMSADIAWIKHAMERGNESNFPTK